MMVATTGHSLGTSDEPRQEVYTALQAALRPNQISMQGPDLFATSRDCTSKGILLARDGQKVYPPHWVVWPESTKDVVAIIKIANRMKVPIIPFGGGSGVCGGTWALRGGITLDLKRMDRVLMLDTRRMQVRVQTGINGEILERFLQRKGLTLGHFPSSIYSATVGGYLACRSAGQFSTKYGKIEDMVEGMQVVLPEGAVVDLLSAGPSRKSLDFKEVFLGSEGTLGVITEGLFRIHPKPKIEFYRGVEFPNLEKSLRAAREMLQRGLKPAVLRIYDPLDTRLASSYSESSGGSLSQYISSWLKPVFHLAKNSSLKIALKNPRLLKGVTDLMTSPCLMILGFQGIGEFPKAEQSLALKYCQKFRGKDLGEGPGLHWYKHRYSVSYKLSPLFDEGFFADTMEVATTWGNLTNLYHAIREAVGNRALVLAHFSHAYHEGCSIYFTFVGYHEKEQESRNLYDRIWKEALSACHMAGGTISHHHGVGVLKAPYMRKEWGDAFEWLCRVKRGLDPKNIFNPGKMGFPEVWQD